MDNANRIIRKAEKATMAELAALIAGCRASGEGCVGLVERICAASGSAWPGCPRATQQTNEVENVEQGNSEGGQGV